MTQVVSFRYMSIQSFSTFCFFRQLKKSDKNIDRMAFFSFYAFKGWLRLVLAEFPRIFIYALV